MGKRKLDQAFQQTLQKGEKIFVPYIMAGDGGLEALADRIQFLEEAGASALEIGIPFSDPVADGPTIQQAGLRALHQGVTLAKVLEELEKTKVEREIPIVLMTYLNPIFAYGLEQFTEQCVQSGVDGLIIPDLPLEEEELLTPLLKESEIALVRLAVLTSPADRLEKIAKKTEAFLYAVTVKGTTGARTTFSETVGKYISQLKEISAVPVLAGFGVSTPDHVKELSQYGDGVVVGSQVVSSFNEKKTEKIQALIQAAKN